MSTIRLSLTLILLLAPLGCATTSSSATTTTSGSAAPDLGSVEAQAAFQQLQGRVAAAGRVALDSDDPEALADQFNTRIGLLQEVGGDAQAVLAYGVPMLSVAALVSQADAYHATGQALRGSPTPTAHAGDEAATAAYRAAVEQQAVPFDQEALRVYKQAMELAEAGTIDDSSTARAKEMIGELTK